MARKAAEVFLVPRHQARILLLKRENSVAFDILYVRVAQNIDLYEDSSTVCNINMDITQLHYKTVSGENSLKILRS